MTNEAMLSIFSLSYEIDRTQILSNISSQFLPGNLYGLLGPNGAGKTTLLKLMSGQLNSTGAVVFDNCDISSLSTIQLAKRISVVHQINEATCELTTRQVVEMGLLPHKTLLASISNSEKANIDSCLTQFGLTDKANRPFSLLSGGEQQRCLIAQALVQNTPILLLDEPVNHLDVFYQHQIMAVLQSMAAKLNKIIILTLHDVNLAARYCSQLLILKQGQLLASGKVDEVLIPSILEKAFDVPCNVTHSSKGTRCVEFTPVESKQGILSELSFGAPQ